MAIVIQIGKKPVPVGEETDAEFLRDLSEKLREIAPNVIGTDDYHIDRLRDIAGKLEE